MVKEKAGRQSRSAALSAAAPTKPTRCPVCGRPLVVPGNRSCADCRRDESELGPDFSRRTR